MKHSLILILFLPLFSLSQIGTVQISKKPIPVPKFILEQIDSFNRADPFYCYLSSAEKEHFYWLNFCRSKPKLFWDSVIKPILAQFPDLNDEYAKSLQEELSTVGELPKLSLNKTLIYLAQTHAKDNLNQGKLNHNNANGKRFDQRIKETQIKKCASENLVTGPSNTLFALVLLYLDIGVPDLGHRKNLLNPIYAEIGIGAATKTGETYYIVQDFACKQ